MSVTWRPIHVIPMPTVLIQWVASTAHVQKALKEMESTVQVRHSIFELFITEYITLQPCICRYQ